MKRPYYRKENLTWLYYHRKVRRDIDHRILGKENFKIGEDGRVVEANYMSGDVKIFWDKVFQQLYDLGMNREEIIDYAFSRSELYKKTIRNYFDGVREIRLSHHLHLLDKMGFDYAGNMKRSIFSSRVELNKIILSRNVTPTFSLVIDPEDWNALEFNVSGYVLGLTQKRFLDMCMNLMKWYFEDGNKDEGRKRRSKSPVNRYRMKILIQRQMVLGNLKIGQRGKEMAKYQPKKRDE